MQTYVYPLSNIFSVDKRYVAPIFQRLYVWGFGEWEKLWQDIILESSVIEKSKQPRYDHFLGAVVLKGLPQYGLQTPAMEIIDGQQRLTTLQILLVAFRDFVTAENHEGIKALLKQLTENVSSYGEREGRYKVWPTTADRTVFEDVFNGENPANLLNKYPLVRKPPLYYEPLPRMLLAYLYFYAAINVYTRNIEVEDEDGNSNNEHELGIAAVLSKKRMDSLVKSTRMGEKVGSLLKRSVDELWENTQKKDNPINKGRLEILMSVLKQNLKLVFIELEERDDAQTIFETLNANGVPLERSDLIRNFVFFEAKEQNDDDEIQRFYQKYWVYYDDEEEKDKFWSTQERQKTISRLDLFFFHFLTCQERRELLLSDVYQEFRDWWRRRKSQPDYNIEHELETIQRYSQSYRSFYEPQTIQYPRLRLFAQRLQMLELSTLYPLLLFLTVEREKDILPEALEGILTDIESFLVRRLVCNLSTKRYSELFLSLLKKLASVDCIERDTVRDFLVSREEGDRKGDRGWPNDHDFRENWLNRDAYNKMKRQRVMMILSAINYHLVTSKQEQVSYDNLTIEHIMPQNWQAEQWPFPSSEDGREYGEHERKHLLHSFGNLTLLSGALNSANSNDPFSQKRHAIATESNLSINKYFVSDTYSRKFDDLDTWTEEHILQRGNDLFEIACKIWPGPGK